MKLKTAMSILMLAASTSVAAHTEVCKKSPGSVTCGEGVIQELTGNGMVSVNRTTVNGPTLVNGTLTADDARFFSMSINGSASLMQCTVTDIAEIKGSLKASSTKFERSLDIYSNSIRFINSKINNNLTVHRTNSKTQEIYLDNNSEVGGDIIFEDSNGKIYVRGGSKIAGKVIGGEVFSE